MNSSLDLKKLLAAAIGTNSKADWTGLREIQETFHHRYYRNEKPENEDTSRTHGVMVEVRVNGHYAYSCTPNLTDAGVRAAAERAREQALRSEKFKVFAFSPKTRPTSQGKWKTKIQTPLNAHSPSQWSDALIRACESLKASDKVVQTVAYARTDETFTRIVDSNGTDVTQEHFRVASHFEATASHGGVVQSRSDHGMMARTRQGGLETLFTSDLYDRLQQVGADSVELLEAEDCPSGVFDVIIMPDQMYLQIHESVGHPLEYDRILGDERNYAGNSFVQPHDFGKLQYGSPLMNITFNPELDGEYSSYAFDDIGNPAKKEYIIKDGILIRGLGGLESQERIGLPGVACSRAENWDRAPIDRMANLNLEVGTSSLDEMVRSIDNGVLMKSNRSWSIDDFRNKFQFGCEYAKKIENGKITKTLKNPNYRGISTQFWRSLKMLGDESTFDVYGSPYCGKGEPNQVIRVGHSSPACLFEKLEVFGGGH